MSGRVFLDTNVFVYEVDQGAPKSKRALARRLIRDSTDELRSVASWQVIQEFMNVTMVKFASPMAVIDAQEYLANVFEPMTIVQPSIQLFSSALEIRARHKIAGYDSLIVAAAAAARCSVLYTEDLQDGARIAGVNIENPFR